MKRISMCLLVAGLVGSIGCTGMNPFTQDDGGMPEPIMPEGGLDPVDGSFKPMPIPEPEAGVSPGGSAGGNAPPPRAEAPVFPEDVNDANWTSQMSRLEREMDREKAEPGAGFAAGRQ